MIPKPRLIIAAAIFLSACVATTPDKAKTIAESISATHASTPKDDTIFQSSYRLGLLHIKTLREGNFELDRQAYERGLQDAMDGKATETVSQADWQVLGKLNHETVKVTNLQAGNVFLAKNKTRKEVITLPSSVQYEVLKPGKDTRKPASNDTVGFVFKITGIDGSVKLDNMKGDVQKMYEIALSKITSKGLQEALSLMTAKSKWRLFLPGELAYGERGFSEKGILPNEALIIDIKLERIISPPVE
ncbi:MAG: hypothetical protein HOO93_05550 [Methyloglobulus sp.]|nr:hypothetical protein [Methyloglobulus sp.]